MLTETSQAEVSSMAEAGQGPSGCCKDEDSRFGSGRLSAFGVGEKARLGRLVKGGVTLSLLHTEVFCSSPRARAAGRAGGPRGAR